MDRLSTVKMLLDITDTTYDAKLNYYLSSIEAEMLAFMNRKDFPAELENTLIQRVIQVYKDSINPAASGKVIQSVTRGDTTITYDNTTVQRYTFLTGDMLSMLRRFRVVSFR
jgi:hypothetical protein